MKNQNIQTPGLRRKKFGSKAYLRSIAKRAKNKTVRTRKASIK